MSEPSAEEGIVRWGACIRHAGNGYNLAGMDKCPDGGWVRYEDHVAEVGKLRADRDSYAHKRVRIATEVCRQDAMADREDRDQVIAERDVLARRVGEAEAWLRAASMALVHIGRPGCDEQRLAGRIDAFLAGEGEK